MQVFSETAYSNQTKLLGQSLYVLEHGIGYSDLAFEVNKGQYLVLSLLRLRLLMLAQPSKDRFLLLLFLWFRRYCLY